MRRKKIDNHRDSNPRVQEPKPPTVTACQLGRNKHHVIDNNKYPNAVGNARSYPRVTFKAEKYSKSKACTTLHYAIELPAIRS